MHFPTAKEKVEKEAARQQKQQDAIDGFKFKSTNSNLDEFSKEYYLKVGSFKFSLPWQVVCIDHHYDYIPHIPTETNII